MKTIRYILFCALLLGSYARSAAQDTLSFANYKAYMSYIFGTYKTSYPSLTFLRYKSVGTPISIYDSQQGKSTDSILNAITYLKLVNDLDISNFDTDEKINGSYIQNVLVAYMAKPYTPISISLVEFNEYKDSVILVDAVSVSGNHIVDNSPTNFYPFQKNKLIAGSPLNQVFTIYPSFLFNDSLFLTNIAPSRIGAMRIDFGDGIGYQDLTKGTVYTPVYTGTGTRIISVQVVVDNDTLLCRSSIVLTTPTANKVANCNTGTLNPDSGPTAITAGNVTGKFAIWFSGCNTTKKLRKPYIISAGFNPGNGKQLLPGLFTTTPLSFNIFGLIGVVGGFGNVSIDVPTMWNGEWRGTYYETYNGGFSKRFSPTEASQCGTGSSNGDHYLDRLRDEGYDIVILDYDKGDDFIENNAKLFEALVLQVNTLKFANGSHFENVVSGYSAGGSSTRLALANMESKYKAGLGPNPHTKMWVGFETESQGANVPLGIQNIFQYQKDPLNTVPSLNLGQVAVDLVNEVVALLSFNFANNPTANEITTYMSTQNGGTHPNRTTLLNVFASIPNNSSNGYPEFCRRVGVSQGSGLGTQAPHAFTYAFDSKLQFGFGNQTAVSFPSTCGGSYTWYLPSAEKRTTANWWGSINPSGNLFTGYTVLNANMTILPKICFNFLFVGCQCIGPLTVGGPILLSNKAVIKPSNPSNYDDAPGSQNSFQIEYYTTSAYPFYNNNLAGNAFANRDQNLHSFAPTASALDLHNPSTGAPASYFSRIDNAAGGLNLLNIAPNPAGGLFQQPDKRFGFPYLAYPTNHYQVTPYDAVYAIGANNGTYSNGTTPKPDNQFHVEDPQIMIGDYLARVEVAPTDLFLSDKIVGSSAALFSGYTGGYIAEFEARNKIIAGNQDATGLNSIYSLYGNANYLTPSGDFQVATNTKAILHCGGFIDLLPGIQIPAGAELDVFIQSYNCGDLLYRVNHNTPSNGNTPNYILPDKGFDYEKPINKTADKKINSFLLYPNPNNGTFSYLNVCDDEPTSTLTISDLTGKTIYSSAIYNNSPADLNLNQLENGMYIVKIVNKNSTDAFKLTITK